MRPENKALLAIVLILVVVAAVGGATIYDLGGNLSPSPPAGIRVIHGTSYYWTYVNAPVNDMGHPYAHQRYAQFEGVLFRVFIYDTMDCPVLNVTGTESGGLTYSFLIYPSPLSCELTRPTVFAPDGMFGASWNETTTVTLLVKVP